MLDQLLVPDLENLIEKGEFDDIREAFRNRHPAEIAELLVALTPNQALEVLFRLDREQAAGIFSEFPRAFQADIAGLLDESDLADLASNMEPDERADFLMVLPKQRYDSILPILAQKERDDIRQLSGFPEDSAGSMMTTGYIAIPSGLTTAQAMGKIRREGKLAEKTNIVFVINESREVTGRISLGKLILSSPSSRVDEIMDKNVQTINALNDVEETLYLFSKYELPLLPVVDSEGALVGVVTHDDAMKMLERDRNQNMDRFTAISGAHESTSYLNTSVWAHFKHRVLWLIVLAGGGIIAGAILQAFREPLMNLTILGFYIPMVLGAGGNSGGQSASVVIRALIRKEIRPHDAFGVIWKELRTALLIGLVLGALVFTRVLLTAPSDFIPGWVDVINLSLAIGLGMALQIVTATVLGAFIPLLAAAVGANPAYISSHIIATVADMSGLLVYIWTARTVLRI